MTAFALLSFFHGLAGSPSARLSQLLQFIVQDFVYIIFSPWISALDPSLIDFSGHLTYVLAGSVIVFAALAYFLISRLKGVEKENPARNSTLSILFGGILPVVLAILPFWWLGLSIYQKNRFWSDRLALAAMVGASWHRGNHLYIDHLSPLSQFGFEYLLGLGISAPCSDRTQLSGFIG